MKKEQKENYYKLVFVKIKENYYKLVKICADMLTFGGTLIGPPDTWIVGKYHQTHYQ